MSLTRCIKSLLCIWMLAMPSMVDTYAQSCGVASLFDFCVLVGHELSKEQREQTAELYQVTGQSRPGGPVWGHARPVLGSGGMAQHTGEGTRASEGGVLTGPATVCDPVEAVVAGRGAVRATTG